MPVFDLYSKRRRDAEMSGKDDVYQYDQIPGPIRVQLRKILTDGLGKATHFGAGTITENRAYTDISKILCREYGLDALGSKRYAYENLMAFFDQCPLEQALDILELGCKLLDQVIRDQNDYALETWERTKAPDELLTEVNYRLRRAGIGYQFEAGMIVRVDSQLIHSEVMKPALRLLADPRYAGAQEEYLSAHEHYRHGRHKEAISEAAKSFESMMKAVCERKGWAYPKSARASDLVKVLRKNHLWPDYLDASFDQLIATLQSGLPQVRNDSAAHGQGSKPLETPNYIAAYALHLAASKIVLLADAAVTVPDAVPAEDNGSEALFGQSSDRVPASN